MTRYTLLLMLILLAWTPPAHAMIFHVSPAGDDFAPGDAQHPFQTISRAAEVARAGDVVDIAPGTYREWVALTQSGTAEKPIVFQADKPGTVVISGADPITLWTPIPEHPGQYIADWPHDFVIDQKPDGTPIRNHGANAPVGCAEQFLWESHPLRQVMKPDDLSPGSFFVDWQFHTVTVWLPGGIDARNANIEGSARPYLFSPLEKYNVFSDARYITLRGLVLRNAANFAQRGGVILGAGWHAEHCTVEFNSAGGMSLGGSGILVDHCLLQYNGFCGISGSGDNNTIEDCIVRGNNRKGFPPDWDGGGGKFTNTRHLRIIRHTSYENTGPGLWLDADNADYSITDSIFYGNHGLAADWEASGICVEISNGPGVIANNIIYSNTGAGILLAESERASVNQNTLADNGKGIELRAMNGRDNHQLRSIDIDHNRFKEWRASAVETSLGDWSPASAAQRNIKIDQNVYDPPKDRPFFLWAGAPLNSLPEIRSALGLEDNGSIAAVQLAHSTENIPTISNANRPTIARALQQARNSSVTLPITWRSPVLENQCAVFDQDNACVMLSVPTAALAKRLEDAITMSPTAVPVLVDARIDQLLPHSDVRATLVEIK